jgi:hypothetical protein
LIAASVGTTIGLVSGYFGGRIDLIVMRLIDVGLAFPYILLALAIVATLGPSLQNALIAIGLAYVPGWARFVRGNVLSLIQNEYVTAARAVGASHSRIISRHVLVNVLPSIIVISTFPPLCFPPLPSATSVWAHNHLRRNGVRCSLAHALTCTLPCGWSISLGLPFSSPCWASTSWVMPCATRLIRS